MCPVEQLGSLLDNIEPYSELSQPLPHDRVNEDFSPLSRLVAPDLGDTSMARGNFLPL
jgi:hypothetical protein